jgi:Ser/Thr protein kinase RdoA (MazF antagonist)
MNQARKVLDRYPADCQPSQIEPLGSAGGMSGAQFWRLDSPHGKLVLRRWPIEHPTPAGLRMIHSVLRHVFAHGLKIVPVPIATTGGETFLDRAGHLWELAPWLPGVADYEKSPSIEKLRAAMTALAQFHLAAADFDSPPLQGGARGGFFAASPAITRRLTQLRELQTGGVNVLAKSINDAIWPDLAPLARQFLTTLPRVIPNAIAKLAPLADVPLPLQPAIRDIWHDHVLFDGNRATGLIDFGAMQIETPAGDVARLLGSLASYSPPRLGGEGLGEGSYDGESETWRNGLAAYSAIRPLTDQETTAVRALDTSGTILAGTNWIRWIYLERREFENRPQVNARFAQLLDRARIIAAHKL